MKSKNKSEKQEGIEEAEEEEGEQGTTETSRGTHADETLLGEWEPGWLHQNIDLYSENLLWSNGCDHSLNESLALGSANKLLPFPSALSVVFGHFSHFTLKTNKLRAGVFTIFVFAGGALY